jgi:hypothetical protein
MRMDPAILDYLIIAVVALSGTTIGFAVAWVRARERALRAESRVSSLSPGLATNADARFSQLDSAIEAVAIEVERVAEAERFQTKLLASRADQATERGNL